MDMLSKDKTKIQKKSHLMVWIFTLALLLSAMPALAQHRVVAYYPGWMKNRLPANRVLFEYITHINHAFAWPLANGSCEPRCCSSFFVLCNLLQICKSSSAFVSYLLMKSRNHY